MLGVFYLVNANQVFFIDDIDLYIYIFVSIYSNKVDDVNAYKNCLTNCLLHSCFVTFEFNAIYTGSTITCALVLFGGGGGDEVRTQNVTNFTVLVIYVEIFDCLSHCFTFA